MFKKGHKRSLESRLRQSATVRGRKRGPMPEWWRQKLVKSHLGLKRSEESKRKQAATITGRKRPKFSEDWRKKIKRARQKQKMKPCSDETRAKIGRANRGKTYSPRSIFKSGPDPRRKQVYRGTSIELKIQSEVERRGILYYPNHDIPGVGNVDLFLPHLNMVIECDGDYWHRLPTVAERDAKKNRLLLESGYRVVRFWEKEINRSPKDCVDRALSYN